MMGKTHMLTGAAASLTACAALHPPNHTIPIIIAATTAATLGPDIDHPKALISRALSPAAWVAKATRPLGHTWHPTPMVTRIVGATATRMHHRTATSRDTTVGGHRTLTHTTLWAAAVGIITGLALTPLGYWWVGVCVTAGHLTHLAGDTITRAGTPLLWPLTIRGKRWWMIRTPATIHAGGWGEKHIITPIVWGAVFAGAVATLGVVAGVNTPSPALLITGMVGAGLAVFCGRLR